LRARKSILPGENVLLPEHALHALLAQQTESRFPALSMAIGKGSETIWQAAAGYADVEKQRSNTPDTAFGIGSITKVFIAVLLLQLCEEGQLPLDAPVSRWLDAKRLAGIANAQRATTRQLLSHYAGMRSWEDEPAWIADARGQRLTPEKTWRPAESLDYIRDKPARFVPGAAFHYSNTHFTLLGLLIETITQSKLEAVLYQRIFQPLALQHTFLEGYSPAGSRKIARRYHRLDPDFLRNAGLSPHMKPISGGLIDVSASNLSVEWAAGGILSTAQDLMTFMLALRNGRLLCAQSMREMQRWLPADNDKMGLSLFNIDSAWGTASGHGGNVLGFSACAWWYEEADCALALLTNVGSMHAAPLADSASRFFRQSDAGRLAQAICARHH